MLPRWELGMLYRIQDAQPYMHDTSANNQDYFRRDLGNLYGRGFTKQKLGQYLPWGEGVKNVKDWYEVTDLGYRFIKIREEFGLGRPEENNA